MLKLKTTYYVAILQLLFILFSNSSFSQNNVRIDSLKNLTQNLKLVNDDIYYNLAIEYYNVNFDSVLFYAKNAIDYSNKHNDEKQNIARYNLISGVAYKNIGKPDSAIFHYNESIKLFNLLNNFSGIASAKNNLGIIYTEIGNYKQANDDFVDAITYYDKVHDTLNIAEVYINLGELCTNIKCFDKATLYFNNAKINFNLVKSDLGLAFVLSGIANLKVKENNLDTALVYYLKSAIIWKKVDRKKETGKIYIQIGNIYKQKKDFNKAIKYLKLSLNNFKDVNYQYGIAESSALLGSIYLELNNISEAKILLENVIILSKEIDAKSILSETYKNLYLIAKQQNNKKKALLYYEKYNELRDLLFNIENNKNIVEIQSKYDILVNQRQIENLRDSTRISSLIIEKNKLDAKQQRNLTLVLLISVVLAILFVLLMYYKFVANKKLSKKLYEALNDREVLLKELHHRVKNNLQIISSLLNLQSNNTKKMSTEEILQISRNRISTMVMIHERLYQSNNFKSINLKEYISDLANNLYNSTNLKEQNITISTDIEEITLDINKLIPCGLIINELVTNCIKHAFNNSDNGNILIKSTNNNVSCTISVIDNGIGLPKDFDISKIDSLGLKLIQGLTKQIKGQFSIEDIDIGSKFYINFKV